jgi:hypothetical protein
LDGGRKRAKQQRQERFGAGSCQALNRRFHAG